MKLEAKLLDQTLKLSIADRGDRLSATIDGRDYELEIREIAEGEYLLVDGNDVYDCQVASAGPGLNFEVQLRGRAYSVGIVDPKRLRSGQSTGSCAPSR